MIESLIFILPALTAGLILGVLVGLVPSLGLLQVLSAIYLFVQGWTPIELLVFYMAALTISQYVDAIPAVYLGVPGETGAIPTAYESQAWPDHCSEIKKRAIKWSAISRTLGCLLAVLVTLWFVDHVSSLPVLFSAKIQTLLFVLALAGIMFTGNNRILINLALMLAGYFLGMIGYNFYLGSEFMTFGFTDLFNGVPLVPVIMGIYVVPSLVQHMNSYKNLHERSTVQTNMPQRYIEMLPTVGRSSVIGYILGLIPGVSYILSSTGSYYTEKKLREKQGLYQRGDMHCTVATETGNSVGAFSTLLPLMLFGLPITVSETLIFDAMIKNGAIFQQGQFLQQNINIMTASFVIVILVSLLASWPLAEKCLLLFQKINSIKLYQIVVVFCVLVLIAAGWADNRVGLFVWVFLICLIPGLLLRKHDVLPLLFVFVLQNSVESSFHDFAKLYF